MADRQYIKNLWEHLFDMSQNRPSDPFKEFVGRNIEEGITVSPEVMKNTKLDSYESLRIYITIRLNDALKHHQQPCSKDNKVCFDIISAAKKEYKIFMDKKIPLTESEAKNLLAYDSMLSLLAISTKIQIGALKVEDIDFEKFRALVVDGNQCENIETSKIILYMLFTPLCEHYQFETCKVLIILLTNKIQLAKEVYANRMNELINYLTRGSCHQI